MTCQNSHYFVSPTLLCSIVLVGLTVPLPYVAINVIKIVSGNIGNAVELEEVCLRGQSPQHRQQPPRRHRAGWCEAVKRDWAARPDVSPIYLKPAAQCGTSTLPSPWQPRRSARFGFVCCSPRSVSSARLQREGSPLPSLRVLKSVIAFIWNKDNLGH